MNRIERLNALAEIRDYLRERVGIIPQGICDDFNILAAHLGASKLSSSWCLPATHDTPEEQIKSLPPDVIQECFGVVDRNSGLGDEHGSHETLEESDIEMERRLRTP
jgi:hypothetical protein